jgi:cysteine desulfurase
VTHNRIYLDHAATTPVRADVLEAMLPYFSSVGYNPSSVHSEGRAARAALDDARDRVAAVLGASRKEITFVGSGTEADNQAIIGVARARRAQGRHIISTAIEHHGVLHALDALRDDGFEITLLPVDEGGVVSPTRFAAAIRPDTTLATIMYANNEIGTVQPIAELARIAHECGVVFHTDAVQAAQWRSLNVRELGVDLLSISAHKFYGPKGVGVLYVREGTPIEPIVYGGGQEFGRRSGTENVVGIIGLVHALETAAAGTDERRARVGALRNRLEAGIIAKIPGVRINGSAAERIENNANVSFEAVDSEALLVRLDLEGVAVSAGSACTSGALEPSHVLAALGIAQKWQQGVIRFSLGEGTTEQEIDRVLELLPRAVADLREGIT